MTAGSTRDIAIIIPRHDASAGSRAVEIARRSVSFLPVGWSIARGETI